MDSALFFTSYVCPVYLFSFLSVYFSIAVTFRLRLRNDLYCVGWSVKLYSLTHYYFSAICTGGGLKGLLIIICGPNQ